MRFPHGARLAFMLTMMSEVEEDRSGRCGRAFRLGIKRSENCELEVDMHASSLYPANKCEYGKTLEDRKYEASNLGEV